MFHLYQRRSFTGLYYRLMAERLGMGLEAFKCDVGEAQVLECINTRNAAADDIRFICTPPGDSQFF